MSRRKQSNPRQFRRSAGPGAAGNVAENQDEPSPVEKAREQTGQPTAEEEWDGPRELELVSDGTETILRSAQVVPAGTRWGPFTGKIERVTEGNQLSLVVTGGPRWMEKVMWVSADDSNNNCVVYSKGGHVWCSTVRSLMEGEVLALALLDVSSPLSSAWPFAQQASVNSTDANPSSPTVFPCKACGIWFQSDRNFQAHLIYYCGTRLCQNEPEPTELPQCNSNFMDAAAVERHLPAPSALPTEAPPAGSSLKCTICARPAESPSGLQHHVLTHLSQTGLRCSDCHFTFQTPRDLRHHRELHWHGAEENKTGLSTSPAKEQEGKERGQKDEANSGIRARFSCTGVKSKPSSPHLGSSPIPLPPFLPQGPLSQQFGGAPQASEILIKMSELVHHRLRHGGTCLSPVSYGTLALKGTTCFECNITFGNLDDYLVHRKCYCSKQWQNVEKSFKLLGGASLAEMLRARQTLGLKDPIIFKTALVDSSEFSTLKTEGTEERLEGFKMSPRVEDQTDLRQTTCQACKITFSHQENFVVHKRFYCASRHDPPMKRATGKPSNQKSFRTRKRKRMMDPIPLPVGCYLPTIGGPFVAQNSTKNPRDQFHQRFMIQGLVPKYLAPSLTLDAPIDLSKKCGVEFGQSSGVMDYHECMVCKISFNKVDDYLSHKQNFCPLDVKRESSRSPRLEDSVQSEVMPSVDQESRPRKMRPDDQIWPYYEIDPTDYATGVFVSQSVSRQSPNEGSEGQKQQQMPRGSHVTADTTWQGATELQGGVRTSPAPKTETQSLKRSVNGPIKYCHPCDIQFNNLSNFITHKKFYCVPHVK